MTARSYDSAGRLDLLTMPTGALDYTYYPAGCTTTGCAAGKPSGGRLASGERRRTHNSTLCKPFPAQNGSLDYARALGFPSRLRAVCRNACSFDGVTARWSAHQVSRWPVPLAHSAAAHLPLRQKRTGGNMQSSMPQSTPLPSCFGSQLAEYCWARRCAVCTLTGT